mgnify:CR=1 FL=1
MQGEISPPKNFNCMQKEESGVTYFRMHKFIEGFNPSSVVICYLSNNLAKK